MELIIKQLISGLVNGSIYALIALGYTMVYGIVKLINFAHGEIYMLGAFAALIFAFWFQSMGWPPLAIFLTSLGLAILVSSVYAFTLDKIAYAPIRKSPRLSALITAIGMSLVLQNFVLLSQTEKFLPFPSFIPNIPKDLAISGYIRSTDILIFATTIVFMIILSILIKYTKLGKAMRATSQDRVMAKLSGVNVNKVISATFVIGAVAAAIGGVLIASHVRQINYFMGFMVGIKAFIAAVLGGIGSIPGAVLGAFILGITESLATIISSAYKDVISFVILIIILTFLPAGILGKSEKEKV